ncbi:MAG: class F sortase [Jatrophihabitantaceae bacterium]
MARAPGIPVAIDIPIRSANHPHGVHASVGAHPLNPDGSLFVPADPRAVSWAAQDAPPGSARGTTIFTSHINYVIDGQTVPGAFADLADYATGAIGKQVSVLLADGRRLRYRIVAGREYHKDQLAGDPALRSSLYDQHKSYGRPGQPPTGRLLLVSCGGAFDNSSGEYEDNVFLYALPV